MKAGERRLGEERARGGGLVRVQNWYVGTGLDLMSDV